MNKAEFIAELNKTLAKHERQIRCPFTGRTCGLDICRNCTEQMEAAERLKALDDYHFNYSRRD